MILDRDEMSVTHLSDAQKDPVMKPRKISAFKWWFAMSFIEIMCIVVMIVDILNIYVLNIWYFENGNKVSHTSVAPGRGWSGPTFSSAWDQLD